MYFSCIGEQDRHEKLRKCISVSGEMCKLSGLFKIFNTIAVKSSKIYLSIYLYIYVNMHESQKHNIEEGLSKLEKLLMDMDNSIVIAGERGYKGVI